SRYPLQIGAALFALDAVNLVLHIGPEPRHAKLGFRALGRLGAENMEQRSGEHAVPLIALERVLALTACADHHLFTQCAETFVGAVQHLHRSAGIASVEQQQSLARTLFQPSSQPPLAQALAGRAGSAALKIPRQESVTLVQRRLAVAGEKDYQRILRLH